MKGLDGKCVVVTGAASGIGWACAGRLIEEGARVMGSDIVEPSADPSGSSGDPASPPSWEFRLTDVTDEGAVAELVAAAAPFRGPDRRGGAFGRGGKRGSGAHASDRGVGSSPPGEPDRHLPRGQARRHRDAGATAGAWLTRCDRHDCQHRGSRGHGRRQCLQCLQRGRGPPHEEHGHRLCRTRHQGERRVPRFHRHPHDAGVSSTGPGWRGPRPTPSLNTSCDALDGPRRSRPRRRSCCRTIRRSSPGTPYRWTGDIRQGGITASLRCWGSPDPRSDRQASHSTRFSAGLQASG